MKPLFCIAAIILSVSLSSCKKAEPVQTVEWYVEHEPELWAMLDKCKANPGELRGTPNCVNAQSAANKLSMKALDQGWKGMTPLREFKFKK
jgi:hypothetical protein